MPKSTSGKFWWLVSSWGCLLLGVALLGGVARAQPAPSADLEQLTQKAAQQGRIRVLVGLNLPTRPEGLVNAQEVIRQRANIKAAQSAVERLLTGTQNAAYARFDSIPFVGLEVDANGLARLRASTLVRDIQEDRQAFPSLMQSVPLVNAPTAWNAAVTGAGWTVAVLDTGVAKSHPFLTGKVVAEACYSSTTSESSSLCPGGVSASTATDSALNCDGSKYGSGCDHGTHVSGIAAGRSATSASHGVARDANLIAVQVFSYFPSYRGVASWTSDQIKGLERVMALTSTYNIAAVNMSLGGGQYSSTCDASNAAIKAAIDNLRSVGVATVIASGNDGYKTSISAPACVSTAVSVGATCDASDTGYCSTGINGVAGYSNIASFVSLVAPGSYINSSVPGGGYGNWSGTSMATPHVAGAWALLKQSQATLGVGDALAHLRTTALNLNDTRSGGAVTGLKRIDLSVMPAQLVVYGLTVNRAGNGSGRVTSSPSGIDCGSDCAESYAAATTVTLSAVASAGSVFTGWSGACSASTITCTVLMSEARSVTAGFEPAPRYDLAVSKTGTGSGTVNSSPAGISCGSDCAQSYAAGTVVKLTAKASGGSRFAGWSGACTGTSTSCTVTMSAARSVSASFNKR